LAASEAAAAAALHACSDRPLRAADPDRGDGLRTSERYALRVLGRTLFKDDRGVAEETITALERLVPIVGAQLTERARQPLRLPLDWPTPRNRRFAETRDALYATIERVLAGHHAAATDDGDLVTKLRDARDPEGARPLSEEEVRDQALIFLIAGHTTTSNALCSTLYLLGRDPQVQARVAAGGDELAQAAVQEALRLRPPAYVLGRRVGAHGAKLGGCELAPGTDVLVSPWITHRHPGFWSDPERFDPWRFVGEQPVPTHAWCPFGGGARACIAKHFALLESKILVRALLERCRLESLAADCQLSQLSSMRPSGPVWIACRPR
jgi:cytochrome P450